MKLTQGYRPQQRRDRLIQEHIHDPYKLRVKLHGPTVCGTCGAVYDAGRWQWLEEPPYGARKGICQACCRIRDKYPAGEIKLTGAFVPEHREEILQLARHREVVEKQEHPLNRIMWVAEYAGSIVIQTTDLRLPHRIGDALKDAYKGELRIQYEEETYFTRVHWQREE